MKSMIVSYTFFYNLFILLTVPFFILLCKCFRIKKFLMLEEKDNNVSPRTFYPKDEKVTKLFTKLKLQRA